MRVRLDPLVSRDQIETNEDGAPMSDSPEDAPEQLQSKLMVNGQHMTSETKTERKPRLEDSSVVL